MSKDLIIKFVTGRCVLFALSVILSVAALFLVVPATRAAVVQYGGYFFALSTTMLFLAWLAVAFLREHFSGSWKIASISLACAATVIGSYVIFVHADFGYKIAMDDYVLANTARNMHEDRQVLTDVNLLLDHAGKQVAANTVIDKRLWLYPLYVSILHDCLGYSVFNSFLLNGILGGLLFLLAYAFGCLLSGAPAGFLTVLLFAGLPLVSQIASGGGMELLGLVLLIVVMLGAIAYLKQPSRLGEGVLVLATVLLAYTRYELALFIAPVALIVLLGWLRSGQIQLSWATILAPLLLVAYGLHILDYLSQPSAWELTRGAETAFSWQYLITNFSHALAFFFAWDGDLANSPMLSVCGLIGLVAFPLVFKYRVAGQRFLDFRPVDLCLIVFAPFLILQFVLILGFHASRLDSPFVSRYSLLFYWLLTLSSVVLMTHFARQFKSVWCYAIISSTCFVLFYTMSVNANPPYSRENFVVNEDRWLGAFADEVAPSALWIDRYLLTHTMREESSLGLNACLRSSDSILGLVDDGVYEEIVYVERLLLNGQAYVPESLQARAMRDRFQMEILAERSFRPYHLTRICRLVSLRGSVDE
ncbi:hypothetical protein QEH59_07775 [Coraliomargarita sp. SDUM461004]|uniref:Glycosyltransferase RgtA/B/C/D-like domain-containing protein n=1 Tax=Thalassobacterium sedimentorum TaxID=3041258 RepID=A0ABU1AHM2_9BACT|nr:hypothetical protein [Coraliomargarita sp. SDUM461004]MDQ8194319.1 hypothetical protein [Coraliomargarita sp. SDUM461004]